MFCSDRQRKAAFARIYGLSGNRFSVSTGSGLADSVVNTIPDSPGDVASTPNKLDDFIVGMYPNTGIGLRGKIDEVVSEQGNTAEKMLDLAYVVDFNDSLKLIEMADDEIRHQLQLAEMASRYHDRPITHKGMDRGSVVDSA